MEKAFIVNYNDKQFATVYNSIRKYVKCKKTLLKKDYDTTDFNYYSGIDELNFRNSDIVIINLDGESCLEELLWLGRAKESNKFVIVYSNKSILKNNSVIRSCNVMFDNIDDLIECILNI